MKVLIHLLFIVAAIITSRADVIQERTRRDGNQVPVGGKVGAYGSSSVNSNIDAQLSAEIGESGAFIDYGLQIPNGFGGLNEVGELYGAEAKAVAGEGQFNRGNIVDEYGLAPPSVGFGYGNQFKTAAQAASASAEVYTEETAANGGTAPADTITQAKLQAQFVQGVQHSVETQADAIIQEKHGVQHDEGTKVKNSYPIMKFDDIMKFGDPNLVKYVIKNQWVNNYSPSYVESLNNPDQGNKPVFRFTTTPRVPYGGIFVGISQVDKDPSSIYYNGPPVNQYTRPSSVPTNDTGIEKFKPTANRYEVTQSPNWIKKGLLHNNANWNPYAKPAQAEPLVQTDIKIEADALTQENGEPQYQKQTQANSVVQTNKGVEVTAINADVEAKTNTGYVGKYDALNGEGFQANAKNHLQSGVQFGGAVEIENRFGQNTHPPRRPMPGFGYRYPYNVQNQG